jgi:hypothetical protein
MARLKALPEPILVMRERLVVHHQSSPQAVEDFIAVVAEMKKEREAGGHPEKEQVDDPMLEEGKLRRQAALGTRGAVRLWTIRVYACTSWDYMHDREVDTFF